MKIGLIFTKLKKEKNKMAFYKKPAGNKKPIDEEARILALRKLRTPFRKDLEMYGKVIQLMGSNQVKVACEDAQDRICRIPGKLFKHVWLKANDIVIVKLWDFQLSKADVIWRYQGFQKNSLERRGELTKLYEYTHDEIFVPEPRYQNTPVKNTEEYQEEEEEEAFGDDFLEFEDIEDK